MLAGELLVGASDPVWRMWNELRTELNIGQFLDIIGAARGERRNPTLVSTLHRFPYA